MTIVIADPDVGFRDKLKRQLEKITGVSVVGESSAAEETTAMIHNRKPDVAIVNTLLQDGSGIEVLRHIKQLMVSPTIIMVTDNPSRDNKNACSIAGADFFFDKTTEGKKVIHTVRLLSVPHSQVEGADSPFAGLDE
jgi:DNA-binding NarL/FixJ family response regulator